jgi:hypothetical protein
MSAAQIRNFSALSYALGFTLWRYQAVDHRVKEMLDVSYFDDAKNMLQKGDMILAGGSDGDGIFVVQDINSRRKPIVRVSCISLATLYPPPAQAVV